MTKVNIASEKKFIDVWQTDIDDEIFIETVKNISLTVNHVSCVLSIEKKKRFISLVLRSCSQLNQSRELYLIEISALTVLFIYLRLLLLYLLFMLLVLVKLHSYDLLYIDSWHY